MKTMIAFAALFASVSVFAADEKPFPRAEILQTELSHLQIDSRLGYGNIQSGKIILDLSSAKMSLNLVPDFHCRGYMYCVQMMPALISMDLPIVQTHLDECGATVYVARLDRRPVDGNLTQVELTDDRNAQCTTFNALPGVKGKLKVVTSGFGSPSIHSVSSFEGSFLVPFTRESSEAPLQ